MTQDEIQRELTVLQRMFEQLPKDVCQLLNAQLNLLMQIINNHNAIVREHVNEQLDDIRLAIKTMEFDLAATKIEKQSLADKLRDAGLE